MGELLLECLGSQFRICSGHSRWLELIEWLWKPFVVLDVKDPTTLVIDRRGEGSWLLEIPGVWAVADEDVWAVVNALRNAMLRHIFEDTAIDALPLHAAALGIDGKGVAVLPGNPGAGKSSIAIEATSRGMTYFSDDVAPLDTDNNVVPFPKPIHLKHPSLIERWGRDLDPPEWIPPSESHLLVPAMSIGKVGLTPSPPGVFVVPDFSPGATVRVEQLSPAETLAVVTASVRPARPDAFVRVRHLCDATPGYRITFGSVQEATDALFEITSAYDMPVA